MKILPTFVVAILISIILGTFYSKSNDKSLTYICTESKTSDYLFITLEETSFFTRLIFDKYDNLKYEISLKESGLYNYSRKNENEIEIFDNNKALNKGLFLSSNNNLFLKLRNRVFKGKCTLYKNNCVNNITH